MNKNIVIGLLIVVIALLALIAFKPKNTVTVSPTSATPVGQTTTINNPNGKDYQPAPANNPVSTPTQTSTQNWKTYTNTQYGFSFAYPSTWKTPQTNPVYAPNATIFQVEALEAITSPFIWHRDSGYTLADFTSQAYGHSASDTPEPITVAGQKGYKYTWSSSIDGRGNPYPLYNQQAGFEDGKGGVYVINYSVKPANTAEGIATFNHILSSFRLQ